ncbi:2'-5' RNA ligase family protein [Loktanella sp. SALINAS62]|uniref:2'-5' RNA ligase family protein n=1 Tax=Loktanella sp. SALINAS62 TaxID=2706124 RepID=UPI0020125F45|nr:2'-5' RNA ligase family protein [Loktanella sp. SALINAS62]
MILTLALDKTAFAWLDDLRQTHFPDRGYRLPAHLTLFHNLPARHRDHIDARLDRLCAATAPFPMTATRVMDLNPGAAIHIESETLKVWRAALADGWSDWLTPQDRHFHAHVTIQNKVTPAASVYPQLARDFTPFPIVATGLQLWHYRGGPWVHDRTITFTGP